MKKVLFLVLTALTAGVVKKKLDAQGADQRLWAEATDSGSGSVETKN
ncbi:hypothetical protein N802_04720 [Knoellia sinensis KCTC 19936]|uniref:Uncharacterized protein n=1 Tax=Knoellia sinensis KCTC 19936 TaxID=1385520 RepID=A0A0A0J531_9MICO|nr:DLW-39 family protein [Knoellia sinensis]KGN31197.1 hypothetical protein N802_04720 [Knoellia sinensis KCTC 19936]